MNFFLGVVGVVQVTRILMHQSEQKKGLAGAVSDIKEEAKADVKGIKDDVKDSVKS